MNRRALLATLVLLAPLSIAPAGELPRSKPEALGLSAEKLAGLQPALEKLVAEGQIPGGVAMITRHGKVAYVSTFGYRELANKTPMTEDTIFAIASMTKPITCIAVMTLVEQGKLGLDDPVGKYLPELKDLRVLGDSKNDTETETATVAAKRPVTVRDLLTHTSGFIYVGFGGDKRVERSYSRAGVFDKDVQTIAQQVERLGRVVLAHQPGEGWTYGLSHDILGRLVEVGSGMTFDKYLERTIFTPLDMTDTYFVVPEAKRGWVAAIYRAGDGGALTAVPNTLGSKTLFSGGGGLFSTGRDYARFGQMLLNGGELEGARVVKPETIAAMTTNQIGDLSAFGMKYGLGFGLVLTPGPDGEKPVLNRYFWAGAFSTNFWIDPRHDLFAEILTQVVPLNHGGADRVFREAVDAAIEK